MSWCPFSFPFSSIIFAIFDKTGLQDFSKIKEDQKIGLRNNELENLE